MSNSSLATIQVPAYSGNYTRGRGNRQIKKITIHHMAGRLTAKRCGELFQAVGRKGSTHYGIGYDGEIAQYVDEANTAWSDSNWESNQTSVTFETANSSTGGQWPVSDATLNSVIKLCADIASRNNLGLLVPGVNLTWHSMYGSTACPGPYLKSKMDYIAAQANALIEGGNIGGYTPPSPIEKPDDTTYETKLSRGYATSSQNPNDQLLSDYKFYSYLSDAKNYIKTQYLINNNYTELKIWEKFDTHTTEYNYTWIDETDESKGYKCTKEDKPTTSSYEIVEFNDLEDYLMVDNSDNPRDSVTSILTKKFKKQEQKEETENE